MVVFPNCKINFGLHILRKRADGYHDLETVFYPVPALRDALELITQQQPILTGAAPDVSFTMSGLAVDGDVSNNLCVKAWEVLREDFPLLPPLQMHLHKVIPMGAGLGGGSADGAFTLKLLNQKFHLALSEEQLLSYALRLGSDCPFFILNKPCFATGRGEHLLPLSLNLASYVLVIVNPGIRVATGWAFSQITPAEPAYSLTEIVSQPVTTWKDRLSNDFEAAVMRHHPEIEHIKNELYAAGAAYASMSGSGSTLYGLFEPQAAPRQKLFCQFLELHVTL